MPSQTSHAGTRWGQGMYFARRLRYGLTLWLHIFNVSATVRKWVNKQTYKPGVKQSFHYWLLLCCCRRRQERTDGNIFTRAMLWIVAVYVNSLVWSPWHKLCNIWSNTFVIAIRCIVTQISRGRFEFFPSGSNYAFMLRLNVYALSRGCCCNLTIYYMWQFNSIRISQMNEWKANVSGLSE